MTREESIKILSILKAAYPNSYKGMTKDEANGVIDVWTIQFKNRPYLIVSIAVNKLISTNEFPPSISEVKKEIEDIYWEAVVELNSDVVLNHLDDNKRELLHRIIDIIGRDKSGVPKLNDMIDGINISALGYPGNNEITTKGLLK